MREVLKNCNKTRKRKTLGYVKSVKFQRRKSNFGKITRPRFATRKKIGIRLLLGYKYRAESGVITRLK